MRRSSGRDDADGAALRERVAAVATSSRRPSCATARAPPSSSPIVVEGGATSPNARVARAIAHSPLVKTAFFASDPNLGRILAAIGYAGIDDLDPVGVSISGSTTWHVVAAGRPRRVAIAKRTASA